MSVLAYPPASIPALKRALAKVYWYKKDLRSFLLAAQVPTDLVYREDWGASYKVTIVDRVVDALVAQDNDGVGPLRRITQALLGLPNLDHLRSVEDGPRKIREAREAIEALRQLASDPRHTTRKPSSHASIPERGMGQRVSELRQRFNALLSCQDAQRRGYLFERFLHDLFEIHDLHPRGSFRVIGEQIDGSFELDGTPFLLESRWTKGPQGAESLDAFSRKVERKLENTLGLFISLNGFSNDGLTAFERGQLRVILVNGQDLTLALEGSIDFVDMLRRKRRHGADTGEAFLSAADMVSGSW